MDRKDEGGCMTLFQDQVTKILEELARDPKDARNRKVINDALLSAYRQGKEDGYATRQERVVEMWKGLVETQ